MRDALSPASALTSLVAAASATALLLAPASALADGFSFGGNAGGGRGNLGAFLGFG